MNQPPVHIARYPNRRFYARNESRYVSLAEIEKLVRSGQGVEIRDSQSNEDITRSVLARIIVDRPDVMRLFPVDMLHFILRSNTVMADFLRDYFQHSLTYLDYLERHGSAALRLAQPMHWVKAWLEGIVPRGAGRRDDDDETERLRNRVAELEAELEQLRASQQDLQNGNEGP